MVIIDCGKEYYYIQVTFFFTQNYKVIIIIKLYVDTIELMTDKILDNMGKSNIPQWYEYIKLLTLTINRFGRMAWSYHDRKLTYLWSNHYNLRKLYGIVTDSVEHVL